jgi:hypothetical protein
MGRIIEFHSEFYGLSVKDTRDLPMRCTLQRRDGRGIETDAADSCFKGVGMGRSKIRGIEMAGVKLAIEVPSNLDWQWPDERTRSLACPPIDPDIHIGVQVARPRRPLGDTFRYQTRGLRFEIGWEGENWAVAIYGDDGCQRTARFDADFRHGEVVVSPEFAASNPYPLAHPLDELIMLHRLMREGCLIVDGSVSIRDRQALLFIEGADPSSVAPSELLGATSNSRSCGQVVLRPVLERVVGDETRIWVHPAPWRMDCPDSGMGRVPLASIHILSSDGGPAVEPMKQQTAANEILQHVFAPVHDPDTADRLLEIIEQVVRRVQVFRMRKPTMKREICFDWDRPQAVVGFAPPAL